jgi:hypothetical protein
MRFVIGDAELRKRSRNIAWGLAFSVLLAAVIAIANHRYPDRYGDALLWSVLGFVVLANLINYYRHRLYLRKVRGHYLELVPPRLIFCTGDDRSELDLQQIAALRLFRGGGRLRHIQILLKNNRGIRLEGYQELDELARLLTEQVPPGKIMAS